MIIIGFEFLLSIGPVLIHEVSILCTFPMDGNCSKVMLLLISEPSITETGHP